MKTFGARTRILAVLSVLGLAACGGGEPAEEMEQPAEEAAEPAPEPRQAAPDTTEAAVWAYLQAQDYRSWPLIPGTTEQYEGQQPHGALLTTRVSPGALAAMEAGESVPAGEMIVKNNFMPDGTLAATTVMYKTEGFDPDHQNWWWLKKNADGSVDAAGRGQGCINCHMGAPGDDFRFLEAAAAEGGAEEGAAGQD